MRGRTAQGSNRFDHLAAGTLDEARSLDLAPQMVCRDFGPERIYAGVERDHVSASFGG